MNNKFKNLNNNNTKYTRRELSWYDQLVNHRAPTEDELQRIREWVNYLNNRRNI